MVCSPQSQDGKRIDEYFEATIALDLSQKVYGMSLGDVDRSDGQAVSADGDGFKSNIGAAPIASGVSSTAEKADFRCKL